MCTSVLAEEGLRGHRPEEPREHLGWHPRCYSLVGVVLLLVSNNSIIHINHII